MRSHQSWQERYGQSSTSTERTGPLHPLDPSVGRDKTSTPRIVTTSPGRIHNARKPGFVIYFHETKVHYRVQGGVEMSFDSYSRSCRLRRDVYPWASVRTMDDDTNKCRQSLGSGPPSTYGWGAHCVVRGPLGSLRRPSTVSWTCVSVTCPSGRPSLGETNCSVSVRERPLSEVLSSLPNLSTVVRPSFCRRAG